MNLPADYPGLLVVVMAFVFAFALYRARHEPPQKLAKDLRRGLVVGLGASIPSVLGTIFIWEFRVDQFMVLLLAVIGAFAVLTGVVLVDAKHRRPASHQ